MYYLFFAFVLVAIVAVPLHFVSVEHSRLQRKHGKDRGDKIGEIYGRLSGDMLFLSLIGLWFSPQGRFTLPIFPHLRLLIPGIDFSIPLVHLVIFVPLALFGALYLSRSVTSLTRKVSESHHPVKVVATGIYARVRHPQYFGFILLHVGFSFLMSALLALLATPLIFIMLYFFARKEEVELTREFGGDYEAYKQEVAMLIPLLRRKNR